MTEIGGARRLTADEQRDVLKKLDGISEAIRGLQFALESVHALLTPCYGELKGEVCILPDRHRGRHLSDAGTEWVDND